MGRKWASGVGPWLTMLLVHLTSALEVPLDPKVLEGLPQPPTITLQSPKDYIFDPRENIVIICEAKGKPHPSFSWTRNGSHFDVDVDSKVLMKPGSGTLVIDISGEKAEAYEATYQCLAHNEHGTALSNDIVVRQSRSPLWSKERTEAITVQAGVSLVLHCRPPAGLPPPLIFWMDNILQKLPLSDRVFQALNGDLYFSNVVPSDTRNDYICFARFPHTQTIQQKQPISITVLENSQSAERAPGFMAPVGASSTQMVLRGQELELECIPEGLPTPEISWRKEGGELPSNRMSIVGYQRTLRISSVVESDAGDYRCTAKNKLGSAEHSIKVTVQASPFWISAPRNLILAPNETGILNCRVSGDPKPKITWSINGMPVDNAPLDPSRKVEEDTVILNHVQSGSSAVYQCNASNEFGYLLANAFVSVLAEPPRVLTPPNNVYQVITNNMALLDCASFGSPMPTITWFKGSTTAIQNVDPYVIHENGTLEIHTAQPVNSGRYTCIATNALGIKENHVKLEVKEPTRILRLPEYKVVERNMDAVFECRVKHDPSLVPTVTWLKDNKALPLGDNRFVVEKDSLTIRDVSEEDKGTYTCIMNTSLDQDSASAMLTVVEQPDPPSDLELTDQMDRSVQLTWIPGDEHNSPTQKFVIQYEDLLHQPDVWVNLTEVAGSGTTARLQLSPYVYYSFRILAQNHVGFSQPSHPSRQYRTNPAAPDVNPSDVQASGTDHNNLVISWKPLTGLQANGPALRYKILWRQKDADQEWVEETVANASRHVVTDTPTYAPYEVKVQAVNDYGSGPEPQLVLGYSGEDLPSSAPEGVQVMVHNSTLAEVHWEPISSSTVRGKLQGYKVYYKRERGVHETEAEAPEGAAPQTVTFGGDLSEGRLPGLRPYSVYDLHVSVLNGKGEGPPSPSRSFSTPEGVPEQPGFLEISNPNVDSLTLEWGPPLNHNGRLTGYTLKYQPVNSTSELGPAKLMTIAANQTSVTLVNLKSSTLYKFYFYATTIKGSGPSITKEAFTVMDTAVANRQVDIATQGWFIGLMCAIALLILVLLIVCFIKRNKGGKYPVKEKEEAHQDPEIQPMKEDDGTFGEYRSIESDTEDNKPLKGSRTASNGTVRRDESDDSLVDYGEGGDGQFNEDGSFIGQYSGKKEKDTHEGNESSEAPSPVNAMNSFI
ncbi:neuronal cell adhesion molecule a isoform X10 [Gadus morhua]|uniref:neuronal cell adhesion molecule a isoform X10 n=1 Tax=Gadus morhua TaxID=8049 RepID=UPI0011B4404C|nr:neuronal cell adhesion molecule-like isoform X10 [Gadus morhua]